GGGRRRHRAAVGRRWGNRPAARNRGGRHRRRHTARLRLCRGGRRGRGGGGGRTLLAVAAAGGQEHDHDSERRRPPRHQPAPAGRRVSTSSFRRWRFRRQSGLSTIAVPSTAPKRPPRNHGNSSSSSHANSVPPSTAGSSVNRPLPATRPTWSTPITAPSIHSVTYMRSVSRN